MDEKIDEAAEELEVINDKLYEDKDETLRQHKHRDDEVDKLQQELLAADLLFDRKHKMTLEDAVEEAGKEYKRPKKMYA